MNLEIKDALQQFRIWRDSSAGLWVTLSEEGKTVRKPCRISAVGKASIVVSRRGEHAFKIRRLDEADFELIDSPEAVMEISWPDGQSCRFEVKTG
jgi:hypothetical protein